ncbi:MAG: hypothetical protein P1P64_01065 [Treponemataceae bacterium]
MALSILEQARRLFAKKKFPEVIAILQPHVLEYRDSFDYHLYLGLSFMWNGEISLALDYFAGARKIRLADPTLLSAQAVLFLRRGDTNKAVDYYLQALQYDPNYKPAKKGLEFIRHHNSPEELGDFIQSGKIKTLYPDPTVQYKNRKILKSAVLSFVVVLILCIVVPLAIKTQKPTQAKRKDLSALSVDNHDKKAAIAPSGDFSLVLTKEEIIAIYEQAQNYFQNYRDNLAQYEVNKLLNSNASDAIKQKARLLMEYFYPEKPGFDTVKDVFDYETVKKEPELYVGCYVVWRGTAHNIIAGDYNTAFDLLVGYETRTNLEGVVPVFCDFVSKIDEEKPIEVLAKVQLKDNVVYLSATSIHQSGKPLNIK